MKATYQGRLYQFFAPEKAAGPRPLILFLHGVGERGEDGDLQTSYPFFQSPDGLLGSRTLAREGAYVVAPQAPLTDQWVEISQWNDLGYRQSPAPTPALAQALALAESVAAGYPVDRQRIYVTGLSMGGFGAFDAIVRRPDLFAAALPVCGGGDPATAARAAGVPVRAAHGAADTVVPPAMAARFVDALRAAGGDALLTVYPGVGHDSWSRAYTDRNLKDWLFRQRRR